MRAPMQLALGAALVCVASLTAGCRNKQSTKPPARIAKRLEKSALRPEADQIIHAMELGDVAAIRERMTPQLRGRVRLEALEAAANRLRARFGVPLGILEEHEHREGPLRWYSGLVLYGTAGEKGVLTPVLYQFAQTKDGRFDRLLVREHWFIENLAAPAEAYVPVTRIHFPTTGQWTILHGGRTRATNYHHGHNAQRFAYDIVVRKRGRQRKLGSSKKDNRSYYCYGKPILAPAAGTVVRAINDVPENRPGTRGRAGGNGVVIDHGFGEHSAIWHAIPGSVTVKVGDKVRLGQQVGRVGNSGRSTGPHIHYHVSYVTPDLRERFGLPAEFVNVYVDKRWYVSKMPIRGQMVQRGAEAGALAAAPSVFLDI